MTEHHGSQGGHGGQQPERLARRIPPEHQAVLDRKLAPNGLTWRKVTCQQCGMHVCDEGILLGCLRKKCPNCKFPNVWELNRVGEPELMEYMAQVKAEEREEGHNG